MTEATRLRRSNWSQRMLFCGVLTLGAIGMSAGAYRFGQPDGPVFYWGILPGAPFLLLALLSLAPRVSLQVLVGAAICSFLTVAIPYGSLVYASANYSGGGANIGLGLLLLATPLLLPIAMGIGGFAGWRWMRQRSDSPE